VPDDATEAPGGSKERVYAKGLERWRIAANGAVVGSALIDALRATLDSEGHATAKTVPAVADLAAALAQGVRGAKQAAE